VLVSIAGYGGLGNGCHREIVGHQMSDRDAALFSADDVRLTQSSCNQHLFDA
jgi:hypothetical protein